METDRKQGRVAEPAEEEIKKHGDPLRSQVAEAARKDMPDTERKPDDKETKAPDR